MLNLLAILFDHSPIYKINNKISLQNVSATNYIV